MKDIIRVDLKEIRCEVVDGMQLLALLNVVMNLRVS
jgi:hypothetical protein